MHDRYRVILLITATIYKQQVPLTGTDAAERVQRVLALFAEPQGRRRMSRGFRGWVTYILFKSRDISDLASKDMVLPDTNKKAKSDIPTWLKEAATYSPTGKPQYHRRE